jgi:D-glycero-D-manno-heptose 1,7-bisphosphate phosphatase
MRPGVFLDLGGTLVLPLKPEALDDYRLIGGAAEAVFLLCDAGFVCVAVSVQSRIAKGLFTEAEFRGWFEALTTELARAGGRLAGPYVCPHRFAAPCECKKAGGMLYRRAAADHRIDLGASFVVGDSRDDMDAAAALGCRGVLVRTGWAVTPDSERRARHVANDVLGAARWIVDSLRLDATVRS